MFAVVDDDWPVLLTSFDAGGEAGSTMGPKGRLFTVSEKLPLSVYETLTMIRLPTSASTGW